MYKILTVLIIFVFINSFGQTRLNKERIENNKYILEFESLINYKIEQKEGKNIFIVENFLDESKPGEAKLPSHDIFIALPEVEQPIIKSNIILNKKIDALPDFNPEIYINNKNIVVYKKSENILKTSNEFMKIKGFLWIRESYCLQIQVKPAIYKPGNSEIELTEKFERELIFPNTIELNRQSKLNREKVSVISNNGFNTNFEGSTHPSRTKTKDSWIDYTKDYLKLGVNKNGIYRISYSDMEQYGVPINSINPKTFTLFCKGEQIPIFVYGEEDLSFDTNDFIEFVGVRNMGGNHQRS